MNATSNTDANAAAAAPATDAPRDKNGLTEAEFLAAYSPKNYPRPSLTADICVFREKGAGLQLLLVRRGGHPHLGCWATPGGFANPNETADSAAARELEEETGVAGLPLEPVALYSTPMRDPRGWTISYAFVALAREGLVATAADDAAAAAWFDVDLAVTRAKGAGDCESAGVTHCELALTKEDEPAVVLKSAFDVEKGPLTNRQRATNVRGSGLAFDHATIVADALLALRTV